MAELYVGSSAPCSRTQAAYLALTQLLDHNNNLVLLLVNTLLSDLKSDNFINGDACVRAHHPMHMPCSVVVHGLLPDAYHTAATLSASRGCPLYILGVSTVCTPANNVSLHALMFAAPYLPSRPQCALR